MGGLWKVAAAKSLAQASRRKNYYDYSNHSKSKSNGKRDKTKIVDRFIKYDYPINEKSDLLVALNKEIFCGHRGLLLFFEKLYDEYAKERHMANSKYLYGYNEESSNPTNDEIRTLFKGFNHKVEMYIRNDNHNMTPLEGNIYIYYNESSYYAYSINDCSISR